MEFFRHDCQAHTDPRILRLLLSKGHEGYGIFWNLIEILALNPDKKIKLKDVEIYANAMRTQCENLKSIILDFELFKYDDEYFWSSRLMSFCKLVDKKSAKAKQSANRRWKPKKEGCERIANAMPPQCIRNANKTKLNKRKKEKEIYKEKVLETPEKLSIVSDFPEFLSDQKSDQKSNADFFGGEELIEAPTIELQKSKKFSKPTVEEVEKYFDEKNCFNAKVEANRFWNFYESNGWLVGKNPMKNWKSAANVNWIKALAPTDLNLKLEKELQELGQRDFTRKHGYDKFCEVLTRIATK